MVPDWVSISRVTPRQGLGRQGCSSTKEIKNIEQVKHSISSFILQLAMSGKPLRPPSISRDRPPSSISRDNASRPRYLESEVQSASVLGKRETDWSATEVADVQPNVKRQVTTMPSQGGDVSVEENIAAKPAPASSDSDLDERMEQDRSPREGEGNSVGHSSVASCTQIENRRIHQYRQTMLSFRIANALQIVDYLLPTPTFHPKQAVDNPDEPRLYPSQKHSFAARQIGRRHSFPSLQSTKDLYNALREKRHSADGGWDSTDIQQTRRHAHALIYRIECSEGSKSTRYHKSLFYEDDPLKAVFVDRHRSPHLAGLKPIYQLRDYIHKFQQSAFVVIKNRSCNDQFDISFDQKWHDETMLIVNDDLKDAIHTVATCPMEGVSKNVNPESLEMPAPYRFLYHHREALQAHSKSVDTSLRIMVEAVLGYINTNYEHDYDEAAEYMSRGMITTHHIEKMYRPNQIVIISNKYPSDQFKDQGIYVVQGWPDYSGSHLRLTLWNWEFQHGWCQRIRRVVSVSFPLKGKNELFAINEVNTYPVTFLSKESIDYLRERGRKYWDYGRPTFVYYNDTDLTDKQDHIRPGRYMVDPAMYSTLHGIPGGWGDESNKQTDPWSPRIRYTDKPTEDDFLVMAPEIPAYDLLEKEWINLLVSNIKVIHWNQQLFEDLVLPPETKRLVKAMVSVLASSIKTEREKPSSEVTFDVVRGKGNGLIMLFHGSPGTGKTLTAESVAEIAKMPLYPITCGDIGTEPDKVEQYLRTVFQLGTRWNCVLLLDEADVFLEERTLTDLQRNSLVSIFLRMMEYYEGILILTSNRVGTFDEAFRSRINIALHYKDLKAPARKQIWSNFLSRLEDTEEGENVDEIKERLDELSKEELNGREIRNALSTARQLASHEGEKMEWKHLKLAIKTATDFGKYLEKFHGHSNREWLKETGIR